MGLQDSITCANMQETGPTMESCQGTMCQSTFLWKVVVCVDYVSTCTGSLCVHRCLDHHRWDPHWCDEACRGGCEGLHPEQLHAKPDCCNWSCNMGDHSQQGFPGAGGGTVTRVTHGFASRCCHLLSPNSSLTAGLFPSPLSDR